MKYTKSSVYCLLFALSVMPVTSMGAIRVGNLSRDKAESAATQTTNARYQTSAYAQQYAAATPQGVVSATPAPTVAEETEPEVVDKCTLIYPDGEFMRAVPTSGIGMNGAEQCTAVVELRTRSDRGEELVLARANWAAGQSFVCNVSEFHQDTLLQPAGEVTFPGDREPTQQDVVDAMNREQKQNAAVKIIGTAVVGALGGNIAGANEPGKDGLLGGGKDKITGTVIGALGGAAVGAGSAFGGKVAGDMILSAGMNAAAGSVVGNMMASDKSVLRIEKCVVETDEKDESGRPKTKETSCLWGVLTETGEMGENVTAYVLDKTGTRQFKVCKQKSEDAKDRFDTDCGIADLTDLQVPGYPEGESGTSLAKMQQEQFAKTTAADKFCEKNGKMETYMAGQCDNGPWIKLVSASKVSKRIPAMIVDVEDKTFGYKKDKDWGDLQTALGKRGDLKIVGRLANGVASNIPQGVEPNIKNFEPVLLHSEDGGVIDMDNKARMGGTLTGAGVGGAMGAFTAYQGAQNDIETRLLAAKREYRDSLQNFYCITGKRFLGAYNDTVMIPAPAEE